jgi:nondiscriminating glutamyl-tRNA synthetase
VVRTRFAPSPTGALHVGNARIAVLNWLFTRQQGGTFILRIEDTDVERGVEGAEEGIFRDLRWLGLDWDEGPAFEGRPTPGAHAPYRQTERLPAYGEFAGRLRASGHAYDCFCTAAEIEERREAAIARGETPHYDRRCAALSQAQIRTFLEQGRAPALRFRVPDGAEIEVKDVVRGQVRFDRAEIGDFILLRSDELPTYNFAVVVDDVLMEITHVIRGVGHLSNTPRQLLLYEALHVPAPSFAHVPMVLGPDRQKLSKRHGAKAISEYALEGYHPDGLVNYLSLLSWSSPTGEEFLTRERLIDEVSLERIGSADVVFDPVKLHWLSAKHIDHMRLDALVDTIAPYIDHERYPIPPGLLPRTIEAIRTHLASFSDVNEHLAAFFPSKDAAPIASLDPAQKGVLEAARAQLQEVSEWSEPKLQAALAEAARAAGVRGRAFYEPLRIALTGSPHGPPFPVVLLVQGRERVLAALAHGNSG